MAISVENMQQLEAALKAEVDNLKSELVQVRSELAELTSARSRCANYISK